MIQRHLDPLEIDDSHATGDAPLPTTSTITNPFSEPDVVGITAGIMGDFPGYPNGLSDEEENHAGPLVVIPAVQEVV
jgi:anaphase-promoting complex subunit 1